jgi:hypothetical protein
MTRVFILVVGLISFSKGLNSQQQPRSGSVRLSKVIAAFLADSGVLTRGLPWTTGNGAGIRWQTQVPVTNPMVPERQKGLTLSRTGKFSGTVGDSVTLPMLITAVGTSLGLARVSIVIPSMLYEDNRSHGFFVTREMVEQALKNEGLKLSPLKCSRDKEGASYGNLVDAVKSPAKTASGLWWYWDSPRQEMTLSLTLLYRKADMSQVECQTGSGE